MTTWRRHSGDPSWHDGAENTSSFVTLCRGRWSLADELDGQVEHHDNPPHHERCEACQRARIDIMRVEEGLRELRDSATYDPERARGAFGFDLGGES
jgi:hypothetical protein